jgi:predicted secreted acid phosphatase
MKTSALSRAVAVTSLAAALTAGAVAPAVAQTGHPAFAVKAAASTTITYAQWQADVTVVTNQAQAYIEQRIAAASSTSNLAIVLDIDNTALANYFSSSYPTPADPPVLAIAKYAASKGVKIFFVTARPDLIDEITEYNLKAVGYPVDGLYSRNVIQLFESIQTFKTGVRQQLEADGYDIIANIGNNWVDLNGGYADTTWKLPDYNGLLD